MNEIRTSNKSDVVLLTLDENAGLAQLTLNRPHCLNAINIELLSALVSCLKIVQVSCIFLSHLYQLAARSVMPS